jgi:hypothetical protein
VQNEGESTEPVSYLRLDPLVPLFLPSTHSYNTGISTSVRNVELRMPPMTTVASGRCTSAPAPMAMAIGTKPKLATKVVIKTGRRRVSEPSMTESRMDLPSAWS